MDKKNLSPKLIAVIIVAIIIVGGSSFYAGMEYGRSKGKTGFAQMQSNRNRMAGFAGADQKGAPGNGFIAGEIIAKDDKSLTVKINNNRGSAGQESQSGTKIIFFSATTGVSKQADGALNDLAVGKQITASGTANSDGSITAQSIQIRPDIINPPQKSQ